MTSLRRWRDHRSRGVPRLGQNASNRTLLAIFCDAANIKGDTCKRIGIAPDSFMTAEDSTSAYGANIVTCNEPPPK